MKLSEACVRITDGKHGDCTKQPGSGYYFISAKDVLNRDLVYENAREITKEDFFEAHKRTQLETDDVLLTNSGTIGRIAIARDNPRTKRTTFQKSVALLKPDKEIIFPLFLYYLLVYKKADIINLAGGTTQQNLLLGDLRNYEVDIPPLPTQECIADILGTLDDKIELNRQMNHTLEAMARAIFKSWFVDFDPVLAKMEVRPYPLPAEVLDLFPDELVESELGLIPKGWGVGKLGDVITLIGGGTPKTTEASYWDGDIPWFSVVDAPSDSHIFVIDTAKKITEDGVNHSSTKVLPYGTTIISARGTVGKCAMVGIPMAMNQSCYGIRGIEGFSDNYVYFLIRSNISDLQSRGHGSVFNTITRSTFESIPIVIPKSDVIRQYQQLTEPFFQKALSNLNQISVLEKIRDALLPRLMSGEIEV